MNTRFHNGLISTMENGTDYFEGELWVKDKRVEYAGPAKTPEPDMVFDREIDLGGNLLMPGFKNAHAHSAMTFLRSYADDLPLLEWLDTQIFPMEAKLRPEQAYYMNILAIMEYLTSGITAAFDMYFYPGEMVKASVDCGFRTVLCGGVNNFISSLNELEENFITYNNMHELISAKLGFHAEYTCSRELLAGISKIIRKYNVGVFTHNSESLREVDECRNRTGMTPTAYMDSLGIFDYGGGCFHCVYLDENDMDIFTKRGLSIVTNPAANLKLASGIPPVSAFMEKGIPIAIGTDGPAGNNCLDMFREMFLTTALQKARTGDASAVPTDAVLRMTVKNGARILGLNDCDSLAVGKYADLIVIDLQQPNMQPLNNIMKNIVYSGSKKNVKLTMINGKILYEDGKFDIGCDTDDIYKKANFIIIYMK